MDYYQHVLILLMLWQRTNSLTNHKSVGCYEKYMHDKIQTFQGSKSSSECVHLCIDAYYKYNFNNK